jgi:hypothetical protein
MAVNAPLWLNPELAPQVARWMFVPKDVIEGARQLSIDESELARSLERPLVMQPREL